jgi:hypothetical protein
MSQAIALPFWVLAILLFFAGWAACEKILLPALRWMVNRPSHQFK